MLRLPMTSRILVIALARAKERVVEKKKKVHVLGLRIAALFCGAV